MNSKKIFVCDTCGSKFLNWESQVGKKRYCSRSCYHESIKGKDPHNKGKKNHISKPCAVCGKIIKGEPSQVIRRKYCGVKCSGIGNRANLEDSLKRYRVDEESGCWLWEGSTRGGYGRLRVNGEMMEAHRASYEAHIGKIPEGLVIDHLCRNRACINPSHLEPTTSKENISRGMAGKVARSEAHKKAISEGGKRRFSNPEEREKQKAILNKARLSEKRLPALREANRTLEAREKQSENMKKIWSDRKNKNLC